MKKIAVMLFSLILLFQTIIIITDQQENEAEAIGIYEETEGFQMDMNISKVCAASFIGETSGDRAGHTVTGVGDVNGDGLNDMLIGALANDEGGTEAGKVYLIFGKQSNWTKDLNISNADASFIGENDYSWAGWSISKAGDLNKDGYDDFLIAAPFGTDEFPNPGKVYLIYGKSSGWTRNLSLSKADASFIGEGPLSGAGSGLCAGDFNGDDYIDIVIGSCWYEKHLINNRGKVYIIFGNMTGWVKNFNLSHSNVSILGEVDNDFLGNGISTSGDVNGDGYDDFLMGAPGNCEIANHAGQSYLILGKASGWVKSMSASNSNASFRGEGFWSLSGSGSSIDGDFNNDGYNDILIGARGSGGVGGGRGYLIFGKSSGWRMDIDLSNADVFFDGESSDDEAGLNIQNAGDINGDGFDDIIIGATQNDEGGSNAGQAYLIYGKSSGWIKSNSLSNVNASFIGEGADHYAGVSVASLNDVNGDGLDDFLIGAARHYGMSMPYNGNGTAYIIFGFSHTEPSEIYSIKTYSDNIYTEEINHTELNHEVFIELVGLDGNETTKDKARINIHNPSFGSIKFPLLLEETGANTGIYRNSIRITTRNDPTKKLIKGDIGDIINISSNKDPTKFHLIEIVIPLALRPLDDVTMATEDEEYRAQYWNIGKNEVAKWSFDSNADWLNWDEEKQEIFGTPNNGDVGNFWVSLNITDGLLHYDEHNFSLTVENTLPSISTENVVEINQDEYYFVDYESDDEGQGKSTWEMDSPALWLKIDPDTGILNGTPLNVHVGSYNTKISIDDGNGGRNWTQFTLTVVDKNDPPIIITDPITEIHQGQNYYVGFNAIEIDDGDTIEWEMVTDAKFLEFDHQIRMLSGSPDNEDVGTYFVNITVKDSRGGVDWLNYTLEVVDVNDPPYWINVPEDTVINEGMIFRFKLEALDIDKDDVVTYDMIGYPSSNISINQWTGKITWNASIDGLVPNPNYVLNLDVTALDGEDSVLHSFTIQVIPNPKPITRLISPANNSKVTWHGVYLDWEVEDDGFGPVNHEVYLGRIDLKVASHESETRISWDRDLKPLFAGEFERGVTYYWTVLPKDWFSYGTCESGIFTFNVNVPPVMEQVAPQVGYVGKEMMISFYADDNDDPDPDPITYSLIEGPEGLELFSDIRHIYWTPDISQVGAHTVIVNASDGYESVSMSFEIVVSLEDIHGDADDKGSPIVLIIIIIIIVLILIGAGIGAFLYLKKKREIDLQKDTETQSEEELTEEGKRIFEQFFGPS